ncbi:MAG: hypothetical protein AAGA12_11550 [Pseudomonadota bacterium]
MSKKIVIFGFLSLMLVQLVVLGYSPVDAVHGLGGGVGTTGAASATGGWFQ